MIEPFDPAAFADAAIAARTVAAVRRAENLRQLRALRKAARDAGLARRHATKLARLNQEETSRVR